MSSEPTESTGFLQLVINALQLGLQRFTDPNQWSLEVIVAVIVALVTLAVAIVKGSASWKRRRKKRFLERSLTTELYTGAGWRRPGDRRQLAVAGGWQAR